MKLFKRKYENYSDEELLALFSKGQESLALEQFYLRYAHLIMGTAIKYTNQLADAEDIVMSVFENLPSKLRKHEVNNFRPWLHMVTKNECLMQLRRTKKEIPGELGREADSDEAYDKLTDEQIALLIDAIQDLKEPQKSCIELFYLQRKSYVEVAEILDLDVKTVKSAIQNGKRNIKNQLIHQDEFKEPNI